MFDWVSCSLHQWQQVGTNRQSSRVGSTPTPTCRSGQGGFAQADVALRSNRAEAVSTLPQGGFFISETSVPPALIRAYRATHYHVQVGTQGYVLRVGHYSSELAAAYARSGHANALFITADNPFSEPVDAAENAAQHAALGRVMHKLTADLFDGFGRNPAEAWLAEQGYLALGIDRTQACVLGIHFRQNAIVWAAADAVPKLILLRNLSGS